ncbi:MAG: lipoprotein-releasing ABC transporter permease subunit [Magnetococcales bacterium]|nr:lipoprotein-releasing ABC transporter permease subunit [Magnetococcales bacterium]
MNQYEWIIGLRHLRAKRSEFFINVITLLSMGGVILGVAALITVLAVLTGYREELQHQILGVTSHVVIRSAAGPLSGYHQVMETSAKVVGVTAVAPYIAVQGMLSRNGRSAGVMLRGVDPELEAKVSSLTSHLTQGKLADMPASGIILGKRLAKTLKATLDDRVIVTVAVGTATGPGATPRLHPFQVVGIFDSGMYEYDNSLAYIRLDQAQSLLDLDQRVTGVDVMTLSADSAIPIAQTVRERLGRGFWVQDWMEMNRHFFRILQIQKTVLFIILLLVVLVAAFNIISSLIMVVMEKGREIAILKTIGARSGGIMKIFVIQGGMIGSVGTALGMLLGLLISWNLEAILGSIEKIFGIQLISGEVYFIDHLPAKVLTSDVLWVTGTSLAITLLATIYPAWRAARIDPVELLRHE